MSKRFYTRLIGNVEIAGHENEGHEISGKLAGLENAGLKVTRKKTRRKV